MISPVRNGVLSLPEPALQLINENDEKELEKKKVTKKNFDATSSKHSIFTSSQDQEYIDMIIHDIVL